MSELPFEIPAAEPPQPRPSASGVVLRHGTDGRWEVLLGLRHRRSRFMPGHLAFPGGGLDPIDRPDDPGAYARCVARELEEETGLSVPPEAWIASGDRTTPPLFPVRFFTRFFATRAPAAYAAPDPPPSPDEVECLEFRLPEEVLAEWLRGEVKLPPPVLSLLRCLAVNPALPWEALPDALAAANAVEERAARIEFVPGVWALPLRTATLPPATHTNAFLAGGRRFVIIDPGSTEAAENARLLEVVERRRQEEGDEPVAVLLTHAHRDHIGGALDLARALDLPLRAHADALSLADGDRDGVRIEPLADGEVQDLDGLSLVPLLTPGHAPGHLAFQIPERDALIAGDLISGMSTILINPEDGDMGQYLVSLERVRALGCDTVLPAHGPPLPGKALERLIRHRTAREATVLDQLGERPAELADIARAAYAEEPRLPAALIERQALSHLLHLEQRGRAARHEPAGRSWVLPCEGDSS